MNRGFEVQLIESLNQVNRRRSRWETYPVSTLNLAVLMLGFISIAAAYNFNKVPTDTLVASFRPKAAIEVPMGADSIAETLMNLPREMARLVAR
jgi:hypothetical protein